MSEQKQQQQQQQPTESPTQVEVEVVDEATGESTMLQGELVDTPGEPRRPRVRVSAKGLAVAAGAFWAFGQLVKRKK